MQCDEEFDGSPIGDDGVSVHPQFEARIIEYWDWLAVALYLLTTVDMLTTVYAARVVGSGQEANPIMRWTLSQGMPTLAALNVLVIILVVVLFASVVRMLRYTPPAYSRYFAVSIEAWLGVLLAAGLLVFANNLSVIVLGQSII